MSPMPTVGQAVSQLSSTHVPIGGVGCSFGGGDGIRIASGELDERTWESQFV
tara:strand:+ start:126126 stop:126281 length:156 start_codon:yes stop_codon:yes gene_type:complete